MLHGRTGFDAVVLGDGTVLAVGDDHACIPGGAMPGAELAELYDPIADLWVEVESLNEPRKTPATVVLADGSAMVLGGLNSDDIPFSSTKIFAPPSRTWIDGPLLERARPTPFATVLGDGRVFVASSTGGPETSSEVYDPRTQAWTAVSSAPGPVDFHDLVGLADGRVLGIGFHYLESEPVSVGYVYDPTHDSWTAVGAPDQLQYELVALRDGGALAIGGNDGGELRGGDGRTVDRVSQFDPSAEQWAPVAPLSTPRTDAQVVALGDGRVFVAGGSIDAEDRIGGVTLGSTEVYDPTTDRWSAAGDLLAPRKDGQALILGNGSVLLLGGNDDYNLHGDTPWCPAPLTSVERFDPGS